jgi:hypothetical protein
MGANPMTLDQWVAENAPNVHGRERQLVMFFQKEWSEGNLGNPLLFPITLAEEAWGDQFEWYVTVENYEVPKEDTGTVRFPEMSSKRREHRTEEPADDRRETVSLADADSDGPARIDADSLETVVLGDLSEESPMVSLAALDPSCDTVPADPEPQKEYRLDGVSTTEPVEGHGTIVLGNLGTEPREESNQPQPTDDMSTVRFVEHPDNQFEATFIMESVPVSEYEKEEASDREGPETPPARGAEPSRPEIRPRTGRSDPEADELDTLDLSDFGLPAAAAPEPERTPVPPAAPAQPAPKTKSKKNGGEDAKLDLDDLDTMEWMDK